MFPRASSCMVLVLMLLAAPAGAVSGIPWFDLELLPDPVRGELVRFRRLACGAVSGDGLPLPGDVRLVFISCHGGPYCPADTDGLDIYERQLDCPPDPTPLQVATMHLVSRSPMLRLAAFYGEALGPGFVRLAAAGAPITFVESAKEDTRHPWSPKRLHLSMSETREPFLAAGYPSQIRITLSVNPPSEPRPMAQCRRLGLLPPDDRLPRRWKSDYCDW